MSKYDIAIVGMGCVFPEANNTEEYWKNILSGEEFVRDMPEHLWQMKQFSSEEKLDHKSVTIKGSFLKDFDFNPIDYHIPPKSLEGVDRAQLVAMEATRQALADAGIAPRSKELEEAVTVIGASGVDEFAHVSLYLNRLKFFKELGPRLDAAGLTKEEQETLFEEFSQSLKDRGHEFHPSVTAVGAIVSSLSNRVAQAFGAKGFNMAVDGACASSFVALTVASHALMAGDARMAIVGGVDLGINPAIYIGFSRLGGLSPNGATNPFDNSANGLVIGEGGGVVILKRVEDAMADGDRIHAVIKGSGCTSDGAGQAIYNPSAEQRTIALKKALKSSGLEASEIQYLEAHATSTVVGDANEYDAIAGAYADREPSNPLYLGTVKHQIGHLKAGAGMAGLIKTVLAMNARKIPHMPRFRELTKLAKRKSDSLVINTELLPWEPRSNGSRYAAVTTSGFGGVNYHVILEQAASYEKPVREIPDRDMAIVGIVNRLPGATSPEEFWANSLAGKNNFSKVDPAALGWEENVETGPENERIGTREIALIDDFKLDYLRLKISPNSVSQTSPAQILSAEMSDRLLTSCGYELKEGKNIGVSIGSMHDDNYATISYPLTADEYAESLKQTPTYRNNSKKLEKAVSETADAVLAAGPPHTEATLPGWMSNINAGIVANRMNCRGPNFTVDTACSSGLASLLPSMYQLMFTDVDAMVTGGLNRHTTNVFATAVDRLGAIAIDTPKPFDKDGAGFIAGEGGVLFLMKRLKDARKAGDTVHGILRNIAGSSEYKSKSMVAPTEEALRYAIEEGMRNVSIRPEEIGVVDTHGSANRLSDIAEAKAIAGVLRPEGAGAAPVHVTAVKSHVGHIYGGSGSAGVLSVLGALNNRQVPGIRNLQNYRPEIVDILDKAAPQKGSVPLEAEFLSGGVTSLGLGGANYFAVLSAGDEGINNVRKSDTDSDTPVTTSPSVDGVFIIRGHNYADIHKAVIAWLDSGHLVSDDSADLSISVSYDSEATLKNKLTTLRKFMDGNSDIKPLELQGVYLSDYSKTSGEKFAFCFPGQGTHYVGMGRSLYENYREFRDVVDIVHNLAMKDLGFDLKGDLYGNMDPGTAAALLGGIDGAQISLFAVEVGLSRVLASLGVVPDVMVGHSFGEISALASQGVWTLEDGYRVVAARIRAAREGGRGLKLKMLSIICDDTQRDALLSLGGNDVVLSNINAPGQFIFAGIEATILKLSETAGTLGLEARLLDIGSAFHSRFMEDAVEPFRKALETLPCNQPTIPIMSTITGDYISFKDSSELAKHLSLQLTTKLDMPKVINKLYADGARNFLEVGPKWAVTKLIDTILKDRDYTAVPSLHPKIGDEETFRRAMAYVTGMRRVGQLTSAGSGAFGFDDRFMTYLENVEPAIVALLNEAHKRYSGNTTRDKVSSPKAAEAPAVQDSPPLPPAAPTAPAAIRAPQATASVHADSAAWVQRSKAALAEATGYPEEMLGEELDLEADLGIDSVQRAEIWGRLIGEFNLDPEARPESIRSINELAAELAKLAGDDTAVIGNTAAAPAGDASAWISRSKSALAEATGYPEDMLGEELDLEADLGIDSVQRAEIWGKLIAEFDLDPEARPESIRSINELAAELAKLSGDTAETVKTVASEPAGDTSAWVSRSKAALAEATGYPEDMLGEELDLEADLGIDSVQRAEIWGKLIAEFSLDPEARPESIRSITELAAELAKLAGNDSSDSIGNAEVSTSGSPAADSPVTTGDISESTNRLFYSGYLPIAESEKETFECRNVLAIVTDAKSGKEINSALTVKGRTIRDITAAKLLAAEGAELESLVSDADTILLLSHGKVHSSTAEGSKLSALLLKETNNLYQVMRALAPALRKSETRVICPISQDGSFGADRGAETAQGAFPAGFIRSLSYELPETRFQLIDTGSLEWTVGLSKAAGLAFPFLEAGILDGEWVRPTLRKVAPAAESRKPLDSGDLVLVTGGARGIVFECVHELAKQTGCSLVLTGRTEPADGSESWLSAGENEIDSVLRKLEMSLVKEKGMNLGEAKRLSSRYRSQWEVSRNLKKLEKDNISCTYARCDVSNKTSLKKLIDQLQESAVIRGVVHGAGVQKSKLFEDLSEDAIALTMETKMLPLFLLHELLDFSELKLFSGFGSIAGLFGNAGQSDYALANDMLASAVAALGARHGIFAQTVEWTAWTGTGMVSDAESKRFEESGLNPVTVKDGVALYIQAVLNTELPRVAAFNEGAVFAAIRSISPWMASGFPLPALKTGTGSIVDFDVTRDVYINQHLVRHNPVVPGTFTTEVLSECKDDDGSVLKDISFRRPVWVREGKLKVEVVNQDGRLLVLPEERPALEGPALQNLSFASASTGPAKRVAKKNLPDFDAETLRELREATGTQKDTFYSKLDESFSDSLITGPVFRGVKSTIEKDGVFYGLLRLTDDAMRMFAVPGDFVINPVVADMAIQTGAAWGMIRHNVMAIPFGIGELRIYKPTASRDAVAVCREIEITPEEAKMDIIVRELDGSIVFTMSEVILKTISGDDQ